MATSADKTPGVTIRITPGQLRQLGALRSEAAGIAENDETE